MECHGMSWNVSFINCITKVSRIWILSEKYCDSDKLIIGYNKIKSITQNVKMVNGLRL